MAKLAQATSKYTIIARFDASGTVEKPDVIGAVFGQTEGLLGQEMDLRELQRTGRIGRIDVNLETKKGKTSGVIIIPSSLDSSETSLIAACMETIERVGPCSAKIRIEAIEDVRTDKRKYVVERAKELLTRMFDEGQPETQEISEQIKEAVRSSEISTYRGLPAGPNIVSSDSIVIVEGRADVMVLLKHGVKNAIAIQGTSVPAAVAALSKEKITTVFLDGDRGGDLILKEIMATCDIDYIARAPDGKEVEELTKKEIFKALRDKEPSDQGRRRRSKKSQESAKAKPREEKRSTRRSQRTQDLDSKKKREFRKVLNELTGTRAAFLLDEENEVIGKVPVREMFSAIRSLGAAVLIFDGEIDQKLVNFCSNKGVKYVIGMRKASRINVPSNIQIWVLSEL